VSDGRATLIGVGITRPDAVDKVRGEAKFVDDLAFLGCSMRLSFVAHILMQGSFEST